MSFVDQLSHAPAQNLTDRSTFDRSMHISTDLSQREIVNVILGSMFTCFAVYYQADSHFR